jgi:hypothetical protein
VACPARDADHDVRKRKKEAREVHKRAEYAQKAIGLKGKMFAKKRHQEKALMKKTIAMHEEKEQKHKADDGAPQNAVPAYLLERDQASSSSGGSSSSGSSRHTPCGVDSSGLCRCHSNSLHRNICKRQALPDDVAAAGSCSVSFSIGVVNLESWQQNLQSLELC